MSVLSDGNNTRTRLKYFYLQGMCARPHFVDQDSHSLCYIHLLAWMYLTLEGVDSHPASGGRATERRKENIVSGISRQCGSVRLKVFETPHLGKVNNRFYNVEQFSTFLYRLPPQSAWCRSVTFYYLYNSRRGFGPGRSSSTRREIRTTRVQFDDPASADNTRTNHCLACTR